MNLLDYITLGAAGFMAFIVGRHPVRPSLPGRGRPDREGCVVTLDQDTALDIVYGEKLVAVQDISQHRWYTSQLIVFSADEGLRGFVYLKPATEMQEGEDHFETIPVETFPVLAKEVKVTRYERAS